MRAQRLRPCLCLAVILASTAAGQNITVFHQSGMVMVSSPVEHVRSLVFGPTSLTVRTSSTVPISYSLIRAVRVSATASVAPGSQIPTGHGARLAGARHAFDLRGRRSPGNQAGGVSIIVTHNRPGVYVAPGANGGSR